MAKLAGTKKDDFYHFNILVNCNARYVECAEFLDQLKQI